MPGIRRNVVDTGTEISIVIIAPSDNCVETRLVEVCAQIDFANQADRGDIENSKFKHGTACAAIMKVYSAS